MQPPAPLSLDPATLLFCTAAFGFLMSAVAFSSARTHVTVDLGWRDWSRAMAAAGGGFLLLYLRGHAPQLLTYVAANGLLVVSAAFVAIAHARLFDLAAPRALAQACLAVTVTVLLAVHALDLPPTISVLVVSGALGLLIGSTAWMILQHRGWHGMPSTWLSLGATLTLTLTFGVRCVGVLFDVGPSSSTRDASTQPSVALLMTGAAFIVATSIGFILTVNDRQRRDALERSRRDGMTGLYNRPAFLALAKDIDATAPGSYAVAMIDIDHFKAINDTHGHAAGDVAIAHAAQLISRSARSSDLAGRYGGEEFCVLLRGCGQHEAQQFADRLVQRVARGAVRLPDGGSVGFTVSVGYAWPHEGAQADGIEPMLARADAALYDAKRTGRNRACAADGAAPCGVPARPAAFAALPR